MRVLHVITGLAAGGAEQQLRLLLRHQRHTAEVAVLTNPGSVARAIRADGTPVFVHSRQAMRRGASGQPHAVIRRPGLLLAQVRRRVVADLADDGLADEPAAELAERPAGLLCLRLAQHVVPQRGLLPEPAGVQRVRQRRPQAELFQPWRVQCAAGGTDTSIALYAPFRSRISGSDKGRLEA